MSNISINQASKLFKVSRNTALFNSNNAKKRGITSETIADVVKSALSLKNSPILF